VTLGNDEIAWRFVGFWTFQDIEPEIETLFASVVSVWHSCVDER
jgi:hypothetical protein